MEYFIFFRQACSCSFAIFFTSSSLSRNILGKLVNMTADVIIPAVRSAMPSDRYTPLKPMKCVSTKHSGISMITFRVTASI